MYSVSVTWYGQSGFRLTAGDSQILIDPFLTDRDDRCYPPPATATEFADVVLVLCTHERVDHMHLPFLRELCAVDAAARIVVPAPLARARSVNVTLPDRDPDTDLDPAWR
jgi:L-ascorbate metabolism protein UlaG (beta-lactamase superfamily)